MSSVDVATFNPGQRHDAVADAIRRDLTGDSKAVIVDSPPGAGKSTLVVSLAAELADDAVVPIIAQTNAQADDLVLRLRKSHPKLSVGRLVGQSEPSYEAEATLQIGTKVRDLIGSRVIVATGAKWAYVRKGTYPIAIIDEAYQMRSDALYRVASRFDRALMVGDPGQLEPFTPADDSRWKGQPDGPVSPAVATVLHNHPNDTPIHQLPVSWRLSAKCAPLVSSSFYPTMQFRAGTDSGDRALVGAPGKSSPTDQVIDTAAEHGWGFLELPPRVSPATDRGAVEAVVGVVIRLLQREFEAHDSEGDAGPVAGGRIAVGVAHRNQRMMIRLALDEAAESLGLDAARIVVDTANRLQGREFHVVVVLHPLSGRSDASDFHLATGRLCVLLSRHRHACIVVGRAGIPELLDQHPFSTPMWLGMPLPIPDGWEANHSVMEHLQTVRVHG